MNKFIKLFKKENLKKNKKLIIGGVLFFAFSFFTYASLTLSDDEFSYLPNSYLDTQTLKLSLTAKGPNNSMDYYPGGYSLTPALVDGKNEFSSIQIQNAPLQQSEIYSSAKACDVSKLSGCYDIIYRFLWTDVSGVKLMSDVPGSDFVGEDGWVDVHDEIISNIKSYKNGMWDYDKKFKSIQTSPIDPSITLKTYWGDDDGFDGQSNYSDISKKFFVRAISNETNYLGIAKSYSGYWIKDENGNYKVSPSNLKNLNYATLNISPGGANILKYKALIPAGKTYMNIITVDMDNYDYDSNAAPRMYSYIDFYLKKYVDSTWKNVDSHNSLNPNGNPIARMAPSTNDPIGVYPNVEAEEKLNGPSGNFTCSGGTIGTPGFLECYANGSKGITQHTIKFDAAAEDRVMFINIENISGTSGNSFAIAGDVDFIDSVKPPEQIINPPTVSTGATSTGTTTGTGGSLSGTTLDGIVGITSVEVDLTGVGDGENNFDDNGKKTKIGALHTYKTQVCNTTQTGVTNVMLRLNRPIKSSLIDETNTGDLSKSSLYVSGSMLFPGSGGIQMPISTFNTDIDIGDLKAGACNFVTYQTTVNTDAVDGDVLNVTNQYKYGTLTGYTNTNQVSNPISDKQVDADLVLSSTPTSGSEVTNGDYITYNLDVTNTGLDDIGTGNIVCPRGIEQAETTCKSGDCVAKYPFYNFKAGTSFQIVYSAAVKSSVAAGTQIKESCTLEYEKPDSTTEQKISNEVYHQVVNIYTNVSNGQFSLYLNSRYKLLNSKDGVTPRDDGYDKDTIRYSYKYTGSNYKFMYPDQSSPGSYVQYRGGCGAKTLPYTPNSVTFNINSAQSGPMSSLNLSSNNQLWNIGTTLPSDKPKTILSNGSLTPSYYQAGSTMNNWFANGGTNSFPVNSTEHRAVANGSNGLINSNINGNVSLDTWQYVPYSNSTCSYTCGCNENGCWSCTVTYPLYRWQKVANQNINFVASNKLSVTVGASTAYFQTLDGQVHTNNKITEDGTAANTYDLGDGLNGVKSAPKLYSPPNSYHGDYVVSSNSSDTNLKSKAGRYIYNKNVPLGHGDVYDRTKNPRNYYDDLLVKQKFGEVITSASSSLSSINLDLNKIYYYPGNLTLYNSAGTVYVSGRKGTVVVGGDLYIKSNVKYKKLSKPASSYDELTLLGIIVKGNIYISPTVTDTVGTWHDDGVVFTGDSTQELRHLGNWSAQAFALERKAPEEYIRDNNEPAESILFYNLVYYMVPPGFGELDDGLWARKFNINQFSGEEVDY